MSENAMLRHGAFSWCELMTTDVEAAKRFYTELLGWTTEEVPGMSYTIVKTGSTGVGGIMAVPPQATGCPPQWGTYVTVDDVDATARKAQELGAKTIMPLTDIPNVGRFYTLPGSAGSGHFHHYLSYAGSHYIRGRWGTGPPYPAALAHVSALTLQGRHSRSLQAVECLRPTRQYTAFRFC